MVRPGEKRAYGDGKPGYEQLVLEIKSRRDQMYTEVETLRKLKSEKFQLEKKMQYDERWEELERAVPALERRLKNEYDYTA